jgi:hypothetical protein
MTPPKKPRDWILEDGVYWIKDPIIGERVNEMKEKDFPFKTEYGLDFCKVNTLDDEVSVKCGV